MAGSVAQPSELRPHRLRSYSMQRLTRLASAAAVVAFAAAACGLEPSSNAPEQSAAQAGATPSPSADPEPEPTPTAEPVPEPSPTATPEPEPVTTLSLAGSGLPTVNGDGYTLWIDGEAIATFSDPTAATFELASEPAADASIEVTLAGAPIVRGTLVDATATLSFADVIGTDFADSSGQYILATPTDGTTDGLNERSGVWWTVIPRAQSLFLPTLPAEWVYEGWTIIDGQPVTSGKFTEPFGTADQAAPFSGQQPGPPLPGEDYLVNAPDGLTFPVDLRNQLIAISIEPADDTDPAPFPAIVLRGTVPADATDHVAYSVDNVTAALPQAMVTVTTS